ncbi:MAG: hypothetical protein WC374_11425 [Phycisphaerae bacterium]|jgi:hypothetical protein
MAYIAQSDFTTYAPSAPTMSAAVFAELAERASEIIDELTMSRIIQEGGLTAFDTDEQAAIKKAVCAEVQTLLQYGGVNAIAGAGTVESASIGKFSYTSKFKGKTVNGMPVSPLISTYLFQTGLLNRGLEIWRRPYRINC